MRKKVKRYFNVIRNLDDVGNMREEAMEASEYYHQVVTDAAKDFNMAGNLEVLLTGTPGLLYYYQGVRTDAQQLRRWMETYVASTRAILFKWFHSDPEAKKEYGELKITEIGKYVEADDEVVTLEDTVRILAEAEHALEDLIVALENRSIMLSNIVKIRAANVHEAFINPHEETENA